MSKEYRGLLAGLRRWNHRRLERRRWQRELMEALAEDDAAIMDALSRILEQLRGEAAARQAALEQLSRRVEAVAARQEVLIRQLEGGRTCPVHPEGCPANAHDNRLRLLEQRVEGTAAGRPDTFPVVPTSRTRLLEPELSILALLAPALSPRVAFDVGAHYGEYSRALLDLGFEVHALEPNPAAREELNRRLGGRAGLTVHACAAGAEDGTASLSLVADESGYYSDPTQFASLSGLPPPKGLVRTGNVTVPVRRLDGLARERGLSPSVVKVDAEGYDLAVLRGMGELGPAILVAEFWDEDLPFSGPAAQNRLPDLVAHARAHGAPYHLVVFRRWGDERAAFFSGWTASPERSWGNVTFFADRELFERARQHLATLLPEARFVQAPKGEGAAVTGGPSTASGGG